MSTLKDVYSQYFQKSKIFLYPALGIRRGQSISLIETYLGIRGKISADDNKLIAVFYNRPDVEFKLFETKYLLGNPLFEAVYYLEDGRSAYIFDFSKRNQQHNFQAVVQGTYTKLDIDHKALLLRFYEDNDSLRKYVDSFLFPSFYYHEYAELLAVDKSDIGPLANLLEKTKELCSKPDMDKEILILSESDFIIPEKTISLSENQQ